MTTNEQTTEEEIQRDKEQKHGISLQP